MYNHCNWSISIPTVLLESLDLTALLEYFNYPGFKSISKGETLKPPESATDLYSQVLYDECASLVYVKCTESVSLIGTGLLKEFMGPGANYKCGLTDITLS